MYGLGRARGACFTMFITARHCMYPLYSHHDLKIRPSIAMSRFQSHGEIPRPFKILGSGLLLDKRSLPDFLLIASLTKLPSRKGVGNLITLVNTLHHALSARGEV